MKEVIRGKVNSNEQLSGYVFFVSQNPEFDYSWNYMRKREMSYVDFLTEMVRLMNNVVEDIDTVAGKYETGNDLLVEIGGVMDVALNTVAPFAKASMMWENFHKIAAANREYAIAVKRKNSVLVAGVRRTAADMEKLIVAALDMMNSQKGEGK